MATSDQNTDNYSWLFLSLWSPDGSRSIDDDTKFKTVLQVKSIAHLYMAKWISAFWDSHSINEFIW